MEKNKKKIGVIFGGRSGEHSVSLMSAKFIISQLDPEIYEINLIGITRSGVWYSGSDVLETLVKEDDRNLEPDTYISSLLGNAKYDIKAGEMIEHIKGLDVIFPVLHGTFGEDGTLQGVLEIEGFAYVGAGVTGSAAGMDKAIFADLMVANGIPIVDTVLILRSELSEQMASVVEAVEQISYPLFIKPANLGSSVGISKVKDRSELIEGLLDAAQYDRRIIVQKGHNVREIEVSVMGNDKPIASVCGEILPGEEFYSYEAKYHDETSQAVIPADISEEQSNIIRTYAVKAYRACDLAGLARVDFFIDKDSGEIFINELNTMPGFTKISMYPQLWEATGIKNQDLVEMLIEYAFERKIQRDAIKRTFRRDE